ncbi:MAG TPA: CHASE2 and HATPase_c domain-containing protein [Alcaligenes faecalis]|nr:CHASE2 and HATPase_c domain-containing protein [Alcaligenes faecalis]
MSALSTSNSNLLSDRIRKEWRLVSILLLLLTLLFSSLRDDFALGRLNNLIYDFTMSAALPRTPAPDVVIIAIDDDSIAALGYWPWRRKVHAQILEQLVQARAVGIDIVFQEPNPAYPQDDEHFARAMHKHGRVVLPLVYDAGRDAINTPLPILNDAAKATGYINIEPDPDGVVRQVSLQQTTQSGRVLPHFSVAMLLAGGDVSQAMHALKPRHQNTHFIPYAGRPGHFNTVPYIDVLRGAIAPTFFQNKYVLIGAWGSGLGDVFPTPMSNADMATMSGVEILANTLQSAREDRWILIPPNWLIALACCLPVLLACRVLLSQSPRSTLLSLLGLLISILLVNWVAMHIFDLWVPPMASLITIMLAYPLWHWRSQEAALRQVMQELRTLELDHPDIRVALSQPQSGLNSHNLPHRLTQLHRSIELLRLAQTKREETLRFISHDMRAPQNSILALASLQRQTNHRLSSDELLYKMEGYASQTLELVDNFISLARAEAMEMVLSPLNLPDLLADCLDDAWASASKRNIELIQDDTEQAWVLGNAAMLRRVFANLIQNAIKYGPDGNRIEITMRQHAANIHINVRDHGWGIPEELQTDVFEPYRRAHEAHTNTPAGSGLGLAFVKIVVNKHAGVITLHSVPGEGSTFTVTLPAIQAPDQY